MPLYEHVLIARQDLSNTQAEGLIEHFSTVLADNGGRVVENEYWGVRTLAYKINKNRKGHYAFLRSDAPSAAVQEMERLARLHDDVMRVMTVRVDEQGHAVQDGPQVEIGGNERYVSVSRAEFKKITRGQGRIEPMQAPLPL